MLFVNLVEIVPGLKPVERRIRCCGFLFPKCREFVAAAFGFGLVEFLLQQLQTWIRSCLRSLPRCVYVSLSGSAESCGSQILHFVRAIPDAEKLNQHLQQTLLFDFIRQSHQGFTQFVIRFAAAFGGRQIADLFQNANLLADTSLIDQQAASDLFRVDRAVLATQQFDNLPLQRRDPAESLLVIRRQIVRHFLKRCHQLIERLPCCKAAQHDVHAMVATRQIVNRPHSSSPVRRIQKLNQVGLPFSFGNLHQQLLSVRKR